ncbi:unnamed protein product [Cuscuta campestris]|uniref:Uncharacterized protein n=1 Tax=Cuscuta campestris TaxID=132261 RepID=A0A484MXU0_9ASTE|nr:unnamed protein product [Cuscuta campestris]
MPAGVKPISSALRHKPQIDQEGEFVRGGGVDGAELGVVGVVEFQEDGFLSDSSASEGPEVENETRVGDGRVVEPESGNQLPHDLETISSFARDFRGTKEKMADDVNKEDTAGKMATSNSLLAISDESLILTSAATLAL